MIEYLFALSGLLVLVAMVRGPSFTDRSLAAGAFINITIIILLLFAVRTEVPLYLDRDWQGSLAAFEALLERFPQDYPSQALVGRCRALVDSPPGPDWDGVTRLSQK